MAEAVEREKKAQKKARPAQKRKRRQGAGDEPSPNSPKNRTAKKTGSKGAGEERSVSRTRGAASGITLVGVLGRILPVVSMAAAFVAVVFLFRYLVPPAQEVEPEYVPQDPQVAASSSNVEEYWGLEDKWLASGVFTTGNKELDVQVKEFCDALTMEGLSAHDNAQTTFNTIVWSGYEERTAEEKPSGADWDKAAARHFFTTGVPAEGVGGTGDVYEFAAAISYCLRYFGFTDALAVPVLRGTLATGQTSSALVVVTNEYGMSCVCDPTLLADGWMLDRDLYSIVVENIEQDLTSVEALGLSVQTVQPSEMEADTGFDADADADTDTTYNTGEEEYATDADGSYDEYSDEYDWSY